VTLYEQGVAVHQLDWEESEALAGSSYGLLSDGVGGGQTLSPTPGASNQQGDVAADDSVVRDLIINEKSELSVNNTPFGSPESSLYISTNDSI